MLTVWDWAAQSDFLNWWSPNSPWFEQDEKALGKRAPKLVPW